MNLEQNKEVVRRYFEEIWNKGNLSAVNELVAPNAVVHYAIAPEPVPIYRDFERRVNEQRNAFPDLCFSVDDLTAEGDKVVALWTFQGSHKGEYMGISPTGRLVNIKGASIYRIADGKIVEGWIFSDDLGLMRQLDILPVTAGVSR